MVPLDTEIDYTLYSTILDAQKKPTAGNLTGPATTGFLQIGGPLREAHFMNDAIVGGDGKCTCSYKTIEIKVYPDIMLLEEQYDLTGSATLHLKLLAMEKLTAQSFQNLSIFGRYKACSSCLFCQLTKKIRRNVWAYNHIQSFNRGTISADRCI